MTPEPQDEPALTDGHTDTVEPGDYVDPDEFPAAAEEDEEDDDEEEDD